MISRFVAAVLALLWLPGSGGAGTYVVSVDAPYPQNTIQWGLDSAADGDTVLVTVGTHTGEGNRVLRFWGKEVVLLGQSGPSLTTIDLEDQDCGIRCGAGVDSAAVIDGFTIRNGWGAGISCTSGACPRIRDCVIEDCFGGQSGGAIVILHSSPTVSDVVIAANTSTDYGGGAYREYSGVHFERVTFLENDSFLGGGMAARWSTATLRDCSFLGNTAGRGGGGIWLGGGQALLSGVVFFGNSANEREGGGLYATNTGVAAIGCKFCQNTATDYGAGAFVRGSDQPSVFVESVFEENRAGSHGGGIYLEYTSAHISRTAFDRNEAGIGGGGLYSWGSSAGVDSCTFYCNSAANVAGGFGAALAGDATLTSSTFHGNSSESGAGLYVVTSEAAFSELIVAFSPIGSGIEVGGSDATTTHCCVFANAGGDSLGGIHFENLFSDPFFCGPADMDLTLRADSPCLPSNNEWGVLMGAWGQGCAVTATDKTTWGRLKAMFR